MTLKATLGGSLFFALAAHAHAQVAFYADFDSSFPFSHQGGQTLSGPIAPTVSASIEDIGSPQRKILKVTVDSSDQVLQIPPHPWTSRWTFSPTLSWTPQIYDPAHTFLKFDGLVSVLRPISIQIQLAGSPATIDLDLEVMPDTTNAFQTFVLPLSSFRVTTFGRGGHPPYPTLSCFGMHGDTTQPETTWPAATNNFIMVDNISYVVAPAVSIAVREAAISISWPTNAAGFALQENADLTTQNWSTVTNAMVISNGVYQITVPADRSQNFYRLVAP